MTSERFYSRGPGSSRTRGPLPELYADSDCLERDCVGCGVSQGAFCAHPDGTLKRGPCLVRQKGGE